MLKIKEWSNQLMSILSAQIKEAIKKEQRVCKLIFNIPKRDNTFLKKVRIGLFSWIKPFLVVSLNKEN